MPSQALSTIFPIASFVLIFIFSYLIFSKTNILNERKTLSAIISFLTTALFLTAIFDVVENQSVSIYPNIFANSIIFVLVSGGISWFLVKRS